MTSTSSTPLSQNALGSFDVSVSVPKYKRDDLRAGIVHFGVGNFHRAHQALYLHRLFEQGKSNDWAIVGAGVLPVEIPHYEALKSQDFLSTVVEQSAINSRATIVGSMIDYVKPTDTGKTIEALARPEIRIVSMTITEGGYFLTDTGGFDSTHPAIKRDAANPDHPETVFGLLVAALRARQKAGILPFTIMSCDNIPHNGSVAKNAVCGLAQLQDTDFAKWIAASVAFPNSMVDRITPVTGDRERLLVQQEHGIGDKVPVFCEDFKQWVLEDNFPTGRPSLEAVGVQFVPDVSPFETMKIRILNGGHASIGYPAGLMGIEFVHEAMQHPLIKAFLLKLEKEEILPVVPQVPDTDVNDYLALICERFANPKIGDTVRRLCFDGSNRQPKFIVPSIKDRLSKGDSVNGLALVSALWCRYCCGTMETGEVVEPNDPDWSKIMSVARVAQAQPVLWLRQQTIYGTLSENESFVESFSTWLRKLQRSGTTLVLQEYCGES